MSAQRSQSRVIQDDYVRTGEAVTLDMTPASPPVRFAAAIMDGITYLGAGLLILLSAARTWSGDSYSLVRVFVVGLISSIMFFIPLIVEIATGGRSLGKWAMNLRVVRDDGGAITARHSAVRVGVGIFENWLMWGGLAFFVELFNKKGKRLGDLAVMPPGLQDWARTATILPLDDALAAEARAFLGTNRGIAPKLRGEVASSLADRLVKRVQTPLPPGLHPEIVIAAILVARRDREWERERERRARGKARFHEATQARFGL